MTDPPREAARVGAPPGARGGGVSPIDLRTLGDVAYADALVANGFPADDPVVAMLRRRARPPERLPLIDVLRYELSMRGWREEGTAASRTVASWKKGAGRGGVRAASVVDAVVQQLMQEFAARGQEGNQNPEPPSQNGV